MEADVETTSPFPEQWLNQILPLPYRVATLLVAGVWLWAINLQYLHYKGIDTSSLLRYPTSPGAHQSTYRLALFLTVPLLASLLLFAVLPYQILPLLYLLYLAVALIIPTAYLSRRGRSRFLATLRRVSVGGLAQDQDGRFADILLADVLTSYAKPVADLYVVVCLMVQGKGVQGRPDRSCGGSYMVPLLIGLPFLIRFRQCIIEAMRARAHGKTGFQHLANAMKYSTAFPVLICSAMKRELNPERMWASEKGLSRLWLLAIFANSLYSFYWDVAKDWDLTLFSPAEERNSPEHPWGLRKQRIFQPESIYYVAMAVDLLLRCTWSLKLSVHLYHLNDLEGGIFMIELFEILRRWMWVFLRIETEWLRQKGAITLDSVPLVDQHAKIDDD
ncbi:hypothetical protein B0A48_07134 [Cryoendolithus antarcticus]|uniref:EXS domain-containing protein n=1 Tax=Cryoendolithus antarcticus TaxID=1507870 RepID=A0A1V8T7P9_9PEZI|nr:hypothetical protein B0A48_07134 [Cryoendolithus antarcticus]